MTGYFKGLMRELLCDDCFSHTVEAAVPSPDFRCAQKGSSSPQVGSAVRSSPFLPDQWGGPTRRPRGPAGDSGPGEGLGLAEPISSLFVPFKPPKKDTLNTPNELVLEAEFTRLGGPGLKLSALTPLGAWYCPILSSVG